MAYWSTKTKKTFILDRNQSAFQKVMGMVTKKNTSITEQLTKMKKSTLYYSAQMSLVIFEIFFFFLMYFYLAGHCNLKKGPTATIWYHIQYEI